MLLEMHCHTSEHSSCSNVPAVELVRQVLAKGLQGLVLTDHHYLWPKEEIVSVRRQAEVPDHFIVLSGQEVSTADIGDVLVFGAEESFVRGTTLEEIKKKFPFAALVWAHPYRGGRHPTVVDLMHPLLNGVEIFNSNQTARENSWGLRDWHQHRFTAIAGTDTHGASYAGLYPTIFDHNISNIDELAQEVRVGRCRPFLKEIPHSGATTRVTEVTIGTKGADEQRERMVIRTIGDEAKWESADRAYHIMEELCRHGFGTGTYRVPRTIDEDEENKTIIEQGMRGKSLYEKMLSASASDGGLYLRLVGEWLAKLHNSRLLITSVNEFAEKEELRLARYLDRFNAISHPQSRKAQAIMEEVHHHEMALVQAHPEELVQGHGDFHPKNIFIGQDNLDDRQTIYVAAIDFESSYVLPPAFDVGYFLAQYRNQLFSHRDLLDRYPPIIFLDSYLKSAHVIGAEFMRQVELFIARTNLSIASYLIKVGLGDSEQLWRVLVEAERALTHL